MENLAWRSGANQRDAVDAEAANVDLDAAIAENEERLADDALEAATDSVGQLTIVDNALLMGPDLQVICAGYPIPIPPPHGRRAIHEALTVRGDPSAEYYDINQHGSRHRAAEAFARQNPGGLAFVASQDGPLRCFASLDDADVVLVWRIQLPTD